MSQVGVVGVGEQLATLPVMVTSFIDQDGMLGGIIDRCRWNITMVTSLIDAGGILP